MEAVAAGDEVARQLMGLVAEAVAHHRAVAVKARHAHVGRAIHGRQAGRGARVHEVARHLGLAVGRDHLAAGQPGHVDRVPGVAVDQFDAVVHLAFARDAFAHARLAQQVHGDLLEDAGADAPEHIVGALPLDDDVVDAGFVQQLAEQQARGAGADDGNLGSHGVS
jgi:hypothetical protein